MLEKWSIRVYREKLDATSSGAALEETWKSVPKELKSRNAVLDSWFSNLMRAGMHEKAERELAAELKRCWHQPLVRYYGLVKGSDSTKQLKCAEEWLKHHGEDPELLLAAARLCLRNELWGKARSYLETVIAIRPTPDAFREYGSLLNQIGEDEAAADAYREGLKLVADTPLPAIPRLAADHASTE